MPMLTSAELAQLRRDILELLPDTCRIERFTSANTNGYVEEQWGTAVASIACRFDPDTRRSEEDVIDDREARIVRYIATLPYDADVLNSDRLIFNSGTYEIMQLHDAHSDRASRRLHVSLQR